MGTTWHRVCGGMCTPNLSSFARRSAAEVNACRQLASAVASSRSAGAALSATRSCTGHNGLSDGLTHKRISHSHLPSLLGDNKCISVLSCCLTKLCTKGREQ